MTSKDLIMRRKLKDKSDASRTEARCETHPRDIGRLAQDHRVSPEASSLEKQHSISWTAVGLKGTVPGRMVKMEPNQTRKEGGGRRAGDQATFLSSHLISSA